MIIIAVDFDGTLVDHVFPEIGEPVEGAFEWLKRFKEAGAFLILYTMRADERGSRSIDLFPGERRFLSEAVEFCRAQGIEFDALNRNPQQDEWTSSPKAYAHVYIDDAAFGCPLNPPRNGGRCTVNWDMVGPAVLELIQKGEAEKIVARERGLIGNRLPDLSERRMK
jgi:hypothetical protein